MPVSRAWTSQTAAGRSVSEPGPKRRKRAGLSALQPQRAVKRSGLSSRAVREDFATSSTTGSQPASSKGFFGTSGGAARGAKACAPAWSAIVSAVGGGIGDCSAGSGEGAAAQRGEGCAAPAAAALGVAGPHGDISKSKVTASSDNTDMVGDGGHAGHATPGPAARASAGAGEAGSVSASSESTGLVGRSSVSASSESTGLVGEATAPAWSAPRLAAPTASLGEPPAAPSSSSPAARK
eukprot:12990029-Alexandrium_andersonii.AAC.1